MMMMKRKIENRIEIVKKQHATEREMCEWNRRRKVVGESG
jgi:hypothetical protein